MNQTNSIARPMSWTFNINLHEHHFEESRSFKFFSHVEWIQKIEIVTCHVNKRLSNIDKQTHFMVIYKIQGYTNI